MANSIETIDFLSDNRNTTKIDIFIEQRTAKTYLTTIEGLDQLKNEHDQSLDLKKLLSFLKKSLTTGGSVSEKKKGNQGSKTVLILQGDVRDKVGKLLIDSQLIQPNQIRIHGF